MSRAYDSSLRREQARLTRVRILDAAVELHRKGITEYGPLAKAAGAKKTIVRVHHAANFSLRGTACAAQLGIDELICPEYLTSLAIARTGTVCSGGYTWGSYWGFPYTSPSPSTCTWWPRR